MSARIRIGTSGWRYASWRGDYYPPGLRQRDELAYLAARLPTVELNGSFYSLQTPQRYRDWAAAVPDGFVFAVKGGRYITHMLRLRGIDTALANVLASGVLELGAALGPMLWQLPPRTEFDSGVLRDFFTALPRTTRSAAAVAARHDEKVADPATCAHGDRPVRHALEARHPSFESDGFLDLCREFDVAPVVADLPESAHVREATVASFAYARLHGAAERYTSRYSDADLDGWARRLTAWRDAGLDTYAYFDNDAAGHAPHDAERLQRRLA